MGRDILSEYGPESAPRPEPGFVDGGVLSSRDVLNYQEPTGPINRHRPSPGLPGGTNVGHAQNGGTGDGATGSPTIGGENLGNCGSQGRRS